jgi:hypothetical protein
MDLVYIQNINAIPLDPTKRFGKVRRMLRLGLAEVVRRAPFTIRLLYEAGDVVHFADVGMDTGYATAAVSAVADGREMFAAEIALLDGEPERLAEKAAYRNHRRGALRHRKPGCMQETKPGNWLAPSLANKAEAHVRAVALVCSILPVRRVAVEVAAFDIHKLKNPEVEGIGYQHGEMYGFDNLREYVLHRDGHKCQNPGCKNKAKQPILQVHHLGFWKGDMTDRAGNLITLCAGCHRPENHKPGTVLWGWEPKLPTFRAAAWMNAVRWRIVEGLRAVLPGVEVEATYGYITKGRRRELEMDKSHLNDAFVVAGGTDQERCRPHDCVQRRRNNRSLERFYDARYMDTRDGKVKSGQELCSGRRTRSTAPEAMAEDLRRYRGHKAKAGYRAIRKERHPLQPGDLVRFDGKVATVKGSHCKGSRVVLAESGKSVATNKFELVKYGKGMSFSLRPKSAENDQMAILPLLKDGDFRAGEI